MHGQHKINQIAAHFRRVRVNCSIADLPLMQEMRLSLFRRGGKLTQFSMLTALLLATLITGCSKGTTAEPDSSSQPPTITVPPASIAVTVGQTATFSVTATGTAPLTYQWQGSGGPIAGATATTYTTPPLTIQNNGNSFAVVVTNAAGSKTSSPATVTVNSGGSTGCSAAPSVPGSPVATANSSSQISVSWSASSAGSSCTVTYNVYRSTMSGFTPAQSNQIVFSQAGTSFVDGNLAAAMTYYYVVVAVDAAGSSVPSAQVSANYPVFFVAPPDLHYSSCTACGIGGDCSDSQHHQLGLDSEYISD